MGQTFIYSRVSTGLQDNTNQTLRLREMYPHAIVIEEVGSGGKQRPELEKLLQRLQPGDELIVFALDRLGRRASEILLLVEDLDRRKIILKSIRESLDFSTISGRFVFQIMAALSEMERRLISERTKQAMDTKRKQGAVFGRPRLYAQDLVEKARRLRAEGMTLQAIANETKMSIARVQQVTQKRSS